jgi:hypothetical protein
MSMFQAQSGTAAAMYRLLASISYVGPLRALPQRTYRVSVEPPLDVGSEGQYAPELLYRDWRDGDGSILAEVNEFLGACGYGAIRFKEGPEGDYFELLIGTSSGAGKTNLTDSGMGISQILPLITQGAASPANSFQILQQPEIHLNPALQVRLMDYLVDKVNGGRQVLVETHSEHLLLRLRRLIAEQRINASDVSLLFVSKDGHASRVDRVTISETGSIVTAEWPRGFFAEQLQDSLELARAQSRRARTDP